MCVKEFLGYICGHCSIPTIRLCPSTTANMAYPPCSIPADRPIFTNEFCHQCQRVLWNQRVLRDEEEHRQRHENGECDCEIRFRGVERDLNRIAPERERRLRPRGRGRGRDQRYGSGEESRGDHRYIDEGPMAGQAEVATETPCPRQGWEPEARYAAYQYVGYRVESTTHMPAADSPRLPAAPTDASEFQHPLMGTGQLMLGQPGAGMMWYPDQNYRPQPEAHLPSSLAPMDFEMDLRCSQRSASVPTERHRKGELDEGNQPQQQPMVVSSAIVRSESA